MKLPGLQYTSPVPFTAGQRLQLALVPPIVANIWRGMIWLNRYEVRNESYLQEALALHGHAVLALWHESIALIAHGYRGRNYHATASYSFDGELAARMVPWFGAEVVRGSSSRGGSDALRELQKAATMVPCVALTIDGPKGPRRSSKPGIAILAARTGLPIIPVAAALTRRKRLRSWDRVPIPLPFGRILVGYRPAIPAPPNDSPEEVEKTRAEVERVLNDLQTGLEQEIGDDPNR